METKREQLRGAMQTMESDYNRREFTRVNVNVATELYSGESVRIVGTLGNVSMSGIFLHSDSQLPVGTTCEISLNLEGGIDRISMRARGTVVRVDPEGMAIHFTEVFGGDSFDHLQNLVRYNSGSQIDQVEQELEWQVGIKGAN